ncbi:helix-turn-helix domain-containing protein [Aeromicrobium massiliense]|uniref:helix-turn-helix domain-containing protein n=1 Tax=Aeromicrobium massiliense TaxID=1464554 RepID=UPI0002D7D4C2|nr:helix-turn-helix domain-containing protein [Aeromicrobium massiliense]
MRAGMTDADGRAVAQPRLDPEAAALAKRVAELIRSDVTAYASLPDGRLRRALDTAVVWAVALLLEPRPEPATGRHVDELFRRVGHLQAVHGHDLDSVQAAFRVGVHAVWQHVRDHGTQDDLVRFGAAVENHVERMLEQTANGYHGARRSFASDPARTRARLLEALLDGAPAEQLRRAGAAARWRVDEPLVLLAVAGADPLPDLGDDVLVRPRPEPAVVVCRAELVDDVLARLAGRRVAAGWAVPAEEVPDSLRFATRALTLVDAGVLPATDVVRCADHATQLWLHAEPRLRQRLSLALLRPLLAETPNSREILSETLLAWLESRDSAPAIAARLGVHPQTIRYRWKRINELFGEDLHDPEFVVQVTMLLKATVPLWKAGDQSDVDRFHAPVEGPR